ncbi:MAG: putative transport system permease protein, partial [Cryptosporangiaceae bacterium]|nr:putative transport system permease protein [Cryptosporangiaceae bacterium]
MIAIWLAGLVRRRPGTLAGVAVGVAVAVALLAALGSFLAGSKATMTSRAVHGIAVDWQVEVQRGADPAAVLSATRSAPGVRTALPVTFAPVSSFGATVDGATQTTGAGVVLGLPDNYATTFPGELRTLSGSGGGALLAQQTASNLHAVPGSSVTVSRPGLPPLTERVAGVTDLPQANSLFQKVGAAPQSQPIAPPDNVLLLPADEFARAFPPSSDGAGGVTTQIHVARSHALTPDPAAAFTQVTAAAHNLEAQLTGGGLVGDNLGAALDAARGDALYAQVLFLFLGTPGAALAALLTATVAGTGQVRRRREQALLRARGATPRALLALAAVEAVAIGLTGAVAGLAGAALLGKAAFGSAWFGASPGRAAPWLAVAVLAGLGVAAATVLLPARRSLRATVAAGRATVGRTRSPMWTRYGLDLILLAAAALVVKATSGVNYALVLAPEGVTSISVNYWAFLGPALFWIGSGLLIWRITNLALNRGRPLVARLLRPLAGPLAGTAASTLRRQRPLIARAVVLTALAVAFATSTAVFNATYRTQAEVDARLTNGADVTVTEPPGAPVPPSAAAQLQVVPGVARAEPLQHRFAYVGADLQDL